MTKKLNKIKNKVKLFVYWMAFGYNHPDNFEEYRVGYMDGLMELKVQFLRDWVSLKYHLGRHDGLQEKREKDKNKAN